MKKPKGKIYGKSPAMDILPSIRKYNKAMKDAVETIADRKPTYGDFGSNAFIAQSLKAIVRENDGHLTCVQAEALDMIMTKIARILNGDSNYADSWHDIAGYAKLAEERCK